MVATTRKKFTIDEYHRLSDLGFFDNGEKVELIRGEIINMSPKRTAHSVCNYLFLKKLTLMLGDLAMVRGQEPISIPPNSEPEPDIAIALNRADHYLSSHPTPTDIVLIAEISDSTLQYDCETKPSLYAEAGIDNYWIFNLVKNHLEVYDRPFMDNTGQFAYRSQQTVLSSETISIPGFANLNLDLAEIFPKLG